MPLPWSTKPIDESGQRYGNWTVIRRVCHSSYECRCDCGAFHIRQIGTLKRGSSQRCTKCMGTRQRKHGMDGTSTYLIWAKMKHRCHSHPAYAGRGIKVCERWNDFRNFLADMGERPANKSLDRIDNNGDYEPGNCRWSTAKQQQRNRRNTVHFVIDGKKQSVGDLAELHGLPVKLVRNRLAVGWSIEKALASPSRKN